MHLQAMEHLFEKLLRATNNLEIISSGPARRLVLYIGV